MAWFKREKQKIKPVVKKGVPDGLWVKCPTCSEFLYKPELEKSLSVCRHCSHHFRVDPSTYLSLLLDNGSSKELFTKLQSKDLLQFKAGKKYKDQLVAAIKKTGQKDAINCYQGKIEEKDVALGIMNFSFIGGSMGSVVGEKVARLIDFAHENNLPLILICASGGARMQEGAISLMQLAKTSSKLAQFSEGGGLYIPILTDPTTGGVTASYGMLGDIILAEPGALIGFAGPRVIKQTIGQDLPEGFQRTEFLKEKGFVDHIITRDKMKATLYSLISMLK
ncbi:MAG: acetyl-CoA carboxylase, carboxyltransferase subunit beta [Candidatus Neomarinimicrobiota bacterium]|jgi:acetyl-CoA carboxylase carboxyl transferase subunit beta|nr:acetyl-CoA carboxylase, carboxyltransferase subunit beta [Candidatus Neomarinimicrobiota bacterium]